MLKYLSWFLALAVTCGVAWARERKAQTAKVAVQAGRAGCRVDLDADAAGATDAAGNLIIADVDPGDHYIHCALPG